MISSTRTLPDGYIQTHEINLAKNKGLAVLLNIAGVFIFILSFVLLGSFANWVRPGLASSTLTFQLNLSTIGQLLALLALVVLRTCKTITSDFRHGPGAHLAYTWNTACADWVRRRASPKSPQPV
jgi:hypothetical protein